MDKKIILAKTLKKVTPKPHLTKRQALEIIYKYVDATDLVPNFRKKMRIDPEQHEELRSLYDNAPIKKLYTYGLNKFGFQIDKIRLDVEPGFLEIKIIK